MGNVAYQIFLKRRTSHLGARRPPSKCFHKGESSFVVVRINFISPDNRCEP